MSNRHRSSRTKQIRNLVFKLTRFRIKLANTIKVILVSKTSKITFSGNNSILKTSNSTCIILLKNGSHKTDTSVTDGINGLFHK